MGIVIISTVAGDVIMNTLEMAGTANDAVLKIIISTVFLGCMRLA